MIIASTYLPIGGTKWGQSGLSFNEETEEDNFSICLVSFEFLQVRSVLFVEGKICHPLINQGNDLVVLRAFDADKPVYKFGLG